MKIVDASRLTEDEFDAALALRRETDLTTDPDITPTTAEELRLQFTVDETEFADHDRVVAFDDDRALAIGHLERTRDEANRKFAVVQLDARNGELERCRPVLARLLDLAEVDGRTSILAWGDFTDDQEEFWTGVGATRRQIDRDSDLFLDQVDPELMTKWIDARTDRAASVRLVGWVGEVPEEHHDALVTTQNAMNDAPRDGIEVEDFVMSPDDVRQELEAWAALGWEIHGLLALEADGSAVGGTDVAVNTHRPDASWQGNTVVLSEHRQRGIGRWIKAAMYFYLRENLPDITRLRTGNAETNDAMLAINVEMGYRPAHASAGWQNDLATLRAGLTR